MDMFVHASIRKGDKVYKRTSDTILCVLVEGIFRDFGGNVRSLWGK